MLLCVVDQVSVNYGEDQKPSKMFKKLNLMQQFKESGLTAYHEDIDRSCIAKISNTIDSYDQSVKQPKNSIKYIKELKTRGK